ncbi:MAG: hypothetical protein AAF447_02715 [Myxococcota bacterium]
MTHLRSTVIVNSMRIVRERGLGAQYWEALGPESEEFFRGLVAQGWVGVGRAVEHYVVLDTLVPNPLDHFAIGRQAAEKLQALYIRTVSTLLRASGALTVERILGRLRGAFDRMMKGGTVTVHQTGLKDAEILLADMPLLDVAYFRNNLVSWLSAICSLAATTARTRVVRCPAPGSTLYRVAWV